VSLEEQVAKHFEQRLEWSELKSMIAEALQEEKEKVIAEGSKPGGVDLEQAVVDAINGKQPKHFLQFVSNLKYSKHQFTSADKLDVGTPSEDWLSWGGRDNTSKADIVIDGNGVSMKMGASAMLFGFGPGDAGACMAAALSSLPNEQFTQSGEVKQLLSALRSMGSAIGRAPLSTLKKARELSRTDDQFSSAGTADDALTQAAGNVGYDYSPEARAELSKQVQKAKDADKKALDKIRGYIKKGVFSVDGETGEQAANNYKLGDELEATGELTKDQEKFQKYKVKHDSIKSQGKENMSKIQTIEQLIEHAEEIEKLEQAVQNIEELSMKVMSVQTNPELRLAYFTEALTGRRKFGEGSKNVATHAFITQEDSYFSNIVQGEGSNIDNFFVYQPLDDANIKKIMNAANFRGKFRSDGIKKKVRGSNKRTGFNLFRSSIIAEIKSSTEGGKKYLDQFRGMMKEALSEGIITHDQHDNLITEGFFGDMASSAIDGIKNIASSAAEKGGEVLSKWTKKIKEAFSGMVDWFQEMYKRVSDAVKKMLLGFKEAISGGMESFVEFMGLTTPELLEEFDPGGDANGDERSGAFLTLFSS